MFVAQHSMPAIEFWSQDVVVSGIQGIPRPSQIMTTQGEGERFKCEESPMKASEAVVSAENPFFAG